MARKNGGFTLLEALLLVCIIGILICITGVSRWNVLFSLEGALEKAQEKYPSATRIDVVERNLSDPSIIKLRDARGAIIATCNLETKMARDYTFSDCK